MASESAWLIDQIGAYTAAAKAGHTTHAHDVFMQVVNRCAQLSTWADRYTPEHVTLPQSDDPVWETLTKDATA